jgi:hypothetical protein
MDEGKTFSLGAQRTVSMKKKGHNEFCRHRIGAGRPGRLARVAAALPAMNADS